MSIAQRRFWWVCVFLVVLWKCVSSAQAQTFTASIPYTFASGVYAGQTFSPSVTVTAKFSVGYYDTTAAKWKITAAVACTKSGITPITCTGAIQGTWAAQANAGSSAAQTQALAPGSTVSYTLMVGHSTTVTSGTFTYTVPAAPTTTQKANVGFRNTTDRAVKYVLYQNGKSIGEITLQPGEAYAGAVSATGTGDISVKRYIAGMSYVDGAWVETGTGSVFSATDSGQESYSTLAPEAFNTAGYVEVVATDTATDVPAGHESTATLTTTGNSSLMPNATTKVVWTTNTGDTLQKEIADVAHADASAITKAIAAISTTSSSGSSSGGTTNVTVDNSGVIAAVNATTTAVNSVKTAVEAINTRAEAQKVAEDARIASNPTQSAMQSQGSAAGTAAAGIVNGQGGAAPTSLEYDVSAQSGNYAEALKFQFPAAFGGATVDLNPFSRSGLLTVANWFRDATRWLALVTLGIWAWKEMAQWVRGLSTIRQASGNAVAAGTGAQATALIAAGLMTVAIVVASTALMAWTFGGIGFSVLRDASGLNPLVGMSTAVVGFLGEIFPIATLLSCLVARFTFNFYASAVFSTCAAVVRFIVP